MATINDIITKFDALKPGLAADFTAQVTRIVEELIASHGKNIRKLHDSDPPPARPAHGP